MMTGYYILIGIFIIALAVTFGYMWGSIMTTAKFADMQAREDAERDCDNGDSTWRE